MKSFILISFFLISMTLMAQEQMNESLPYGTIPDAPETYTAGSVVSRMVDGLGFRYRWATEGLTEDDLNYAPGNEGRTITQTLNHLYGLSRTIVNSAKKQPNDFTVKPPELGFEEIRKATLENFQTASELFLKSKDLTQHKVIFKRADKTSEFPFWNNINGPIEDAVWHAGQIVVLRRSAGNPINPKVSVFLGKLKD